MIRVVLIIIMSMGSFLGFSQDKEVSNVVNDDVVKIKDINVNKDTMNFDSPSFEGAKFEVKNTNLTFEIELIQVF